MGGRKGSSRALMTLLHNSASWQDMRSTYRQIEVPVRVVWGDHDWSHEQERRQETDFLPPKAEIFEVKNGGHFLSIDQPRAVIEQIQNFQSHGMV
jgi:pimeloyl-ACP methyl ester carboxylesterase